MWLIADVMSSAVIPLCSGAALYFVTSAFIALVHYAIFCVYMMLLALFFGVRCQLAALSTVPTAFLRKCMCGKHSTDPLCGRPLFILVKYDERPPETFTPLSLPLSDS